MMWQPEAMNFRKDRSAGYLANHMARLFAQRLRERVSRLGLGPAQFPVILELHGTDGRTQKELVERLDIEQATVANTIKRMERDGLVERRANVEDGRSRIIRLTPRGEAVYAPAIEEAKAVNERAFDGFTDAERACFVEMVSRVIDALRERD